MSGKLRFKVRQRAVEPPCRCGSGVGIYTRREGRAEERSKIAETMRKKGYTEEQIKDLLGDA